ncbi:MAG: FecR domain-containing protein [Verrucomicrobiales bacterium]|nr:FecR domain-containing protein [Verrucomicrobiales bacterium]
MNDPEFSTLLDKYLNQMLSEEEFVVFQEVLKSSAERRRQLICHSQLDAGLMEVGGTLEVKESSPVESHAGKNVSSSVVSWLAVAAAVAVSTLTFFALALREDTEPMAHGFAVLTRTVNPVWKSEVFEVGSIVPKGSLQLESGSLQVEFFGGATLVMEGPGNLEIRSASEAFCHSGKLRASVPPAARGFVIDTPSGKVVDLGTEFGLEVGDGGVPEIHVFEGEVEIHESGGEVQTFYGGEAGKGAARFPADVGSFLSTADLNEEVMESVESKFSMWRRFSRELSRDERLIAYFPMENPDLSRRRLFNEAPTGSEMDGAIVGANRVEGRWAGVGKGAVEFTPTGSRVRLAIPGEYGSLTFACWVRIDSLDRQYNGLYLADNYQPGECHWQLQKDGRILFSFLHSPKVNFKSLSPVVWDISKSGQWLHLAVTLDLEKQKVTHYANGEIIFEHPIGSKYQIAKTRFGSGELGNWGFPNAPDNEWFAIRNLNGRIDEFAIFSEALDPAEILEMYTIGNPQ